MTSDHGAPAQRHAGHPCVNRRDAGASARPWVDTAFSMDRHQVESSRRRREIQRLSEHIRQDARHRDVTVLDQRPISRRAYPDGSLALRAWDDRTKAIFRSFSPGQNLDLYASEPGTSAPLIKALTRSEDWKFLP